MKSVRKESLYTDNAFPGDFQLNDFRKANPDSGIREIEWKRPAELCKRPCFIDEDGASRFDLDQGKLGDCWFISAAATLTRHPDLFKVVVPCDQNFGKNYSGAFHFKFWFFGDWCEVIIDDRLPTDKENGKLLFCSNVGNPSEMWPALLEKAYAKLCGSYEAIDGGWSENALVDFTGGIGHNVPLKNKKKLLPDLYEHILRQDKMCTLMACSTEETEDTKQNQEEAKTRLIAGHAYSITRVAKITDMDGKVHQLIRLLNPWGDTEWNGAWSRRSKEWKNVDVDIKKEWKEDLIGKENGEFWMSYEDWLSNFVNLSMCYLPPTSTLQNRRGWRELKFYGSWVPLARADAGKQIPSSAKYWTINVSYVISVTKPDFKSKDTSTVSKSKRKRRHDSSSAAAAPTTDDCFTEVGFENGTIVVSVMRKIKNRHQEGVAMAFDIYKAKTDELPQKLTSSNYKNYVTRVARIGDTEESGRELSHCFHDDHGVYVIVPWTYDTSKKTDYLLRIFSDSELTAVNNSS